MRGASQTDGSANTGIAFTCTEWMLSTSSTTSPKIFPQRPSFAPTRRTSTRAPPCTPAFICLRTTKRSRGEFYGSKNPWVLTYDYCDEIQDLYTARRQFKFALNYSVQ